jgi:hypothetical protein
MQQQNHENAAVDIKEDTKNLRAVVHTLKSPRTFFVLRKQKESRFNPSGKP